MVDPQAYIDAGIVLVVDHVNFSRPAIHAALEPGSDSFWEVIETLLTNSARDFEVNLQRLVPAVSEQELHRWGRAISRCMCAALLDKRMTPEELGDELGMLVAGYVQRLDRGGQAVAAAPGGATA